MTDRWNQTIHATFIDGALSQIAICDGSVTEVAEGTMAEVATHHDDVKRVSRTFPIGEVDWPVELVYEHTVTLEDGVHHQWRHLFRRPDEPWPMLAATDGQVRA